MNTRTQMRTFRFLLLALTSSFILHPSSLVLAAPLGTAFTYQGRLNDGSNAATGSYDLDFALFAVPDGGSPLGMSVTYSGLPVSNGLFTVTLDFGASPFNGDARWLQIQVRTNGGRTPPPYTLLSPRQPLTPTPFALYAPSAGSAVTASNVAPFSVTAGSIADGTITAGKLASGQVVKSVNGLFDVVTLSAGTNVTLAASGNDLKISATPGTVVTNAGWGIVGNSGTTAANFLGTLDGQPLELRVNGQRALRLEPGDGGAPNVVGGSISNRVAAGMIGVTIAGGGSMGSPNRIEGNFGSIGGGSGNTLQFNAFASLIAAGHGNTVQSNAQGSAIGGGFYNTIQSNVLASLIAGGDRNTIQSTANDSAIGGGSWNLIQRATVMATIGGGGSNVVQVDASQSTIGGGYHNTIQTSADGSTISGGQHASIQTYANFSTISGGDGNTIQANAHHSTIAGGYLNTIEPDARFSSIGGGSGNVIKFNASAATIAGGERNLIQFFAEDATIGGGASNNIGYYSISSIIGGGSGNRIGEDADYATVPGGYQNTAAGVFSLAAGRQAHALHRGSFVWADATDADHDSTGDNQFCVRASGGMQLSSTTSLYGGSQTRQMLNLYGTNYGIGVQASTLYFRTGGDQPGNGFAWYRGGSHNDNLNNSGGGATLMTLNNAGLTVNGTFVGSSDRNLKENFATVSPREVLDKVAALPISRWNFKGDATTPHVGPMAQDFHAAFGLGTDDKHIATVDADGVALAAIQGLNQKLEEQNAALEKQVAELKALVQSLAVKVNGGGK